MIFQMQTHVSYGTGRGLSISICVTWGMHLSPPLSFLYALTPFFNFCKSLMPCYGTTWTIAPARAPARMPSYVLTSVLYPDHWAYVIIHFCNCPLVLAVCVFSCGFDWGCHSLPIVFGRRPVVPRHQRLCLHCASNHELLGMSDTWFFDSIALLPVRE